MQSGHRAQAWLHRPAYRRPRHFHAEPELNFVFRGRAVMGVGEGTVSMEAGDVLLLHPGQDHEMLTATDDLELVVAAVTPELMHRCLLRSLPAGSRPFRLPTEEMRVVSEQLLSLDAPTTAEAHERLVGDLFGRTEGRFDPGHPTARRALELIDKRPDASSARLARAIRVQPSELSRQVHGQLGLRFVDFRARQRLMRFILLVDAGRTFTHAALDAGFGSYAQCHRVFHRYLACSPTDYFTSRRSAINGRCEPLTGSAACR
jgi:AraC-like DNA-binding protein